MSEPQQYRIERLDPKSTWKHCNSEPNCVLLENGNAAAFVGTGGIGIPAAANEMNSQLLQNMQLVLCEPKRHAEAILAIFNEAILNSTALYDYKPRTRDMMNAWFEAKSKGGFPVIGIENDSGHLMGFGSFGTFRAWPAYKYSVEHSVYVDARFRGQGVGTRMLEELIAAASKQDYHVLVGAIDASNSGSIRLHQKLGFAYCGTIRDAGFKFGRWLDLVFYQLILPTPSRPAED